MKPSTDFSSSSAQARLLSRREMLGLSASTLLALGLWPGTLRAQGKVEAGSFHFVVINDLHYMTHKCAAFLDRVLAKIKSGPAPDFCLIAGDLSHHGTEKELRPVKEIFSRLGVPVHVLLGNHDYITQTDRSGYDAVFPERLNYQFTHKGWQFLGFDSTEGLRAANTLIHESAVRFLAETLSKISKTQPTVAFTHFPLGDKVNNRPRNAEAVLQMFKAHNLQGVFGGHYHAFTERTFEHASVVTNRCCAFSQPNHDKTSEKGYFVCEAKEGLIRRSFVEVPTAGV
jgi:calcineurin-like phosphoesterase family protein